ncbi:hypothetical protein J121_1586 [Qipengyuania citrea LAMA 915]|uniref:Uncharacterized protein n=1 Tax=Qipengyuania citrea LAMA 915 TaxID=1306953 RepID=A0A0L1KAR1_9SPHN|nr:hypothetical protein J121_1586 [Qipengyuania citrea LAMA 915]
MPYIGATATPGGYHDASKMETLAPCKLLLSWAHSTRAV